MKILKRIAFSIFAVLFMAVGVNAQSVEMTAEELIATAKNGTIKMEQDVTITTRLDIPEEIKVIDLNNKTITLKGCLSSNEANSIYVNYSLEIKNGTVTRYVSNDSSTKSLIKGSLIAVSGENANLVLNSVILDGKNLGVTQRGDSGAHGLNIKNGASATVNDSKIKNNRVIYNPSVYSSAILVEDAKKFILNNTEVFNNTNEDHSRGGIIDVKRTEEVKIINSKIYSNNMPSSVVNGKTVAGTATVAIENCGSFVFDKDSIIRDNKAGEAAGIHITSTNSTIAGTIEGNEATLEDGLGGGLYTFLTDSTKTITVTETAIIRNNKAAAGAGIVVNGPDKSGNAGMVIIDGATITGNESVRTPDEGNLRDGGGAGIYVYRGELTINDVILENNESVDNIGSAIIVSHQNRNTDVGKLTIRGGKIDGTIALGMGEINITGGTFTENVEEYVTEVGYATKKIGDIYAVGKEHSITIEEVTAGKVEASIGKAVVGETVTLTTTPNEGYEVKSIKVVGTANTEVPVKDNKFIMPNAEVTVTVEFAKVATSTDIPVIDTDEEVKDVVIGVTDKTEVEKVLLESLDADEDLKELAEKESLTVAVEIEKVEIAKEDENKITDTIKAKYENIVVSEFFDITVAVKNAKAEEVATISKLTDKIKLVVALSEDLKKVEEGKSRNYYVIRQHGEEIEIIENVKVSEDGKSLIFETDRFSTYAIAYEDVNVKVPQTGDNILTYIVLGGIAILGIAGTVTYIKKKNLFNV